MADQRNLKNLCMDCPCFLIAHLHVTVCQKRYHFVVKVLKSLGIKVQL